ncbi:MAG: Asparagine synthetase 1 [Candidatus Parcubacteria bacterium]|jgi:asparagine synthase (glutamine-hydrolysing)
MCAIAGTVNIEDEKVLKTMLDLMAHRGPDDNGEYYDHGAKVSIGHCRLSILDLSSAGHQPMLDADSNIVVVFNGEIYNYKDIKLELVSKGHIFCSNTDTEVLIHGYKEYGTDIFKKLDGMWAVALYDKTKRLIIFSRDPSGMKPLYFYHSKNILAFASEIGALVKAMKEELLTINENPIKMYLAHRYIYGTQTIYNEIKSSSPGSTSIISLDDLEIKSTINYIPEKTSVPANLEGAVTMFNQLFEKSVGATLQSDVPVGLFLSGGVDSSLVGHAVKKLGVPLRSFTVDFENQDFNEGHLASLIAKNLGLPHVTWPMTAKDIEADVYDILDSFGQPFGDMSALPTFYASRMARREGYKVMLTGDGADELFGGYPTHYLPKILGTYQHVPKIFDPVLSSLANLLPSRHTKLGMREKIQRFLFGARSSYRIAHAKWKLVFNEKELQQLILSEADEISESLPDFEDFFDRQSFITDKIDAVIKTDFQSFLPYDCLVKGDISSMQNGVEIRSPFLNKEIIGFAWYLPSSMKAKPFQTKILLRRSLLKALPHSITRLPKMGFVPPLSFWLAHELRAIMTDILSPLNIAKVGFLNYDYVLALMQEHISKSHDHAAKLWCLMGLVRFYSLCHIKNSK